MNMKMVWSFPILILLASCSQPAKYVIVSDEMKTLDRTHTDQRYVCLTMDDARSNPDILTLQTKSDVLNYGKKRRDGRDPIEDVLFHLIRDDYQKAQELLSDYGDRIPEYLRLVLMADLASEGKEDPGDASRLVKMYQKALDVKSCAINREIINLRIRQLRYGR